jgi:hypothetical protein
MLLQDNPEALAEVQKDPQKLVQILDYVEKAKKETQGQQPQNAQKQSEQEPLGAKPQNATGATQQPQPSIQNLNQQPQQNPTTQKKDSYTYIPSSEPVKYSTTLSDEQIQKVNAAIAKADEVAASSMVF